MTSLTNGQLKEYSAQKFAELLRGMIARTSPDLTGDDLATIFVRPEDKETLQRAAVLCPIDTQNTQIRIGCEVPSFDGQTDYMTTFKARVEIHRTTPGYFLFPEYMENSFELGGDVEGARQTFERNAREASPENRQAAQEALARYEAYTFWGQTMCANVRAMCLWHAALTYMTSQHFTVPQMRTVSPECAHYAFAGFGQAYGKDGGHYWRIRHEKEKVRAVGTFDRAMQRDLETVRLPAMPANVTRACQAIKPILSAYEYLRKDDHAESDMAFVDNSKKKKLPVFTGSHDNFICGSVKL